MNAVSMISLEIFHMEMETKNQSNNIYLKKK